MRKLTVLALLTGLAALGTLPATPSRRDVIRYERPDHRRMRCDESY
jgi:hypothetical protein